MMADIDLPIAPDHPAFAGHFPGTPIVPGVVLLDLALVAIGTALGQELSACHINSVKFLSPVKPGEPVQLRYEAQASGAIRFDLSSGERKVASAVVRAAQVK
jgi:3-hydroxyacyl-[acyl-carrier-protein] dehydratase